MVGLIYYLTRRRRPGGTTQGSQYDLVDVSGNAFLDGDLLLALTGGFVAMPTDSFTIFDTGNLLGSFDNIANGGRLAANGGGSFLVNYGVGSTFDPDQIVLSDFSCARRFERSSTPRLD